jgi:hypothetical protein
MSVVLLLGILGWLSETFRDIIFVYSVHIECVAHVLLGTR